MPTADELMEIARACAAKIDLSDRRQLPSLEDVEEQCSDEYEELLDILQEDDVFGAVDVERQQQLSETIEKALPEAQRPALEELLDQQTRQLWLMQQAAFHVGVAIGLRIAGGTAQ